MQSKVLNKKKFKILLVYPNLPLMLVPPLSIAIFTSVLKKSGYQVDLFDTTSYVPPEINSSPQNRTIYLQARDFNDEDDLGVSIKTDLIGDYVKKVKEFKPNLVIYSVVEDPFPKALDMIRSVENLGIKFTTLVGGVLPTADPRYVLSHKEINLISKGEGEKTILEVAEAVRLKKSLKNIKGTFYKDESGEIHQAPPQPLVDINEIQPDYSLFDDKRFYRPMGGRIFKTIPVETYRGCPYKCTFCNSPMHNTHVKDDGVAVSFLRRKTIKNVRKEIVELIRLYNPEFLYFVDDSFLARPGKEIHEFCDMYEEFKIPFWFNTRPENCKPEFLKRLNEVGSYRISFGIECGNESFRNKVLLRKPTNEDIIRSFEDIADSGIAFSVNLIIGFPGETRELVLETADLVRKIKGYDTLTVSIFTPYRGTVLREVAIKNGWLDPNHITIHTTSSSVLKMPKPYLSSKDIDGLMRVLPLYVYFPKDEWKIIQRAEINDDEGNKILDHYSEIYKNNFLKEYQETEKIFIPSSGTGCKSNPKDQYTFYEKPINNEKKFSSKKKILSEFEIKMLTIN